MAAAGWKGDGLVCNAARGSGRTSLFRSSSVREGLDDREVALRFSLSVFRFLISFLARFRFFTFNALAENLDSVKQ